MSHGDEIKRVFDDPSKFAIDAGIEVVGLPDEVARLVRNAEVTFAALYNGGTVDADVSRDGGDLTGTPSGGAATDGLGNLDLRGINRAVDYPTTLNVDQLTSQGAIRIGWIPNYNGSPTIDQTIVLILKAANDANQLNVRHLSDGRFFVQIRSLNGSVILIAATTVVHVAQAGVLTEIELNFDLSGAQLVQLFIQGVEAINQSATGNRSGDVDVFRTGDINNAQDSRISELAVFDQVQHTANYTPGLAGLLFSKDNPTIKSASTTLVTGVLSFSAIDAIDNPLSLDTITHMMEINGQPLWFDGNAWVNSDLSTPATRLATSNIKGDLTAEVLAQLPLAMLGSSLRVIDVLHSEDGITTPTLSSTTLGVVFRAPDITIPRECIVFGRVLNQEGEPQAGVEIVFSHDGFVHGSNQVEREIGAAAQTLTDSNGEWQLQVIETQSIGLSPYNVRIDDTCWVNIQVPDLANAEFGTFSGQPIAA